MQIILRGPAAGYEAEHTARIFFPGAEKAEDLPETEDFVLAESHEMTDLILVAVSSLLAFSLRNVIVLGEGNDSMASFLISVGFIVFICISPIILTVVSARRLSFSELLYFGD